MKITVCIGSSCHLKGSRDIVDKFQSLISENALSEKVELSGAFCMGNCRKGVCVDVDGKIHTVTPENAEKFFKDNILSAVN